MIQTIFKRYEKKYLLSPMQYSFLKKHLDQILQVDTYGLHTILIRMTTPSFAPLWKNRSTKKN